MESTRQVEVEGELKHGIVVVVKKNEKKKFRKKKTKKKVFPSQLHFPILLIYRCPSSGT